MEETTLKSQKGIKSKVKKSMQTIKWTLLQEDFHFEVKWLLPLFYTCLKVWEINSNCQKKMKIKL
jgi:hypothetical protein